MSYQIEALLLADNIYQDVSSKKFILSGIFHQINTATLPFKLANSFGIFISVSNLTDLAKISIQIVDPTTNQSLAGIDAIEINGSNVNIPVTFGIEVPPFEIHNAGKHFVSIKINNQLVHSAPLIIHKI